MAKDNELTPAQAKDEFTRLVEKCREGKLPDIIENASIDHAFVLLENLLIAARTELKPVLLVSGSFMPSFYNKLLPELERVLAAGCSVRGIAVDHGARIEGNRFLEMLDKRGGVKLMPGAPMLHFACVGDTGYRIEIDAEKKTAQACFNDQGGTITTVLRTIFEQAWSFVMPQGGANVVGGTLRPA